MFALRTQRVTQLGDTDIVQKKKYDFGEISATVTMKQDSVHGTASFNTAEGGLSIRFSGNLDGGELVDIKSGLPVSYHLELWLCSDYEQKYLRMSAKKAGVTYKMSPEEKEHYNQEIKYIIYHFLEEVAQELESIKNE